MKCTCFKSLCYITLLLLLATTAFAQQNSAALDRNAIAKAAGTEASLAEGGVVRIGWTRDDVPVQISGRALDPAAGLGSWAAFHTYESGAILMGDTVVFEDEITPAMDTAFKHGLTVTALHNHFTFDRPPVYFMHIGGTGKSTELAAGVKAMWDAIKAVRKLHPQPQAALPKSVSSAKGRIKPETLERILPGSASVKDNVVKFSFPRTGRMNGVKVGGSMGLATWAAFSSNAKQAMVYGEFIMTEAEVQPVIQALRKADLHIVALHNHMIGEEPNYYFLHYLGQGAAEQLARGLREVMDVQERVQRTGSDRKLTGPKYK